VVRPSRALPRAFGREAGGARARHEVRRIVALIGAHCRARGHTGDPLQQEERRVHLGLATRSADHRVHNQAMLVVDQRAGLIREHRPRLRRLPRQPGLGIRHRAVRPVGAPLPMEADPGVVRIHGTLGVVVHRPHALLAPPRLQQGPVHREVLPRQQLCRVGQVDGVRQELGGDCAVEQALPVLGEGGGVPRRRLQVEADNPAEEQVVLERLNQLLLAVARVEQGQQQSPQQLLRRDLRAPGLAVERRELRR
jgi:hypothetical protein